MRLDGVHRAALAALLLASVLAISACGEKEQTKQAAPTPAPTVTVAAVAAHDVTPSVTFNGRIEAADSVDLRARVEGFIEKRQFEEGAEVKAGDLLVVIEKAPYETQIGQIKGQLTSAEGSLRLAKTEVGRKKQLVDRQAVAQVQLDVAEGQYAQALGEQQRLQAALRRAELDLSYTDIKAPISGNVGRFAFSVGDFVTPSSGSLAVIVSQDPMYVTFPVSARQLLAIQKAAEASGQDPRSVKVKVRLPDGSTYGEIGTINFVDVRVDPTTDTVSIRATIPNPKRLLVHNQLVGVIVEQARPVQALLIPQSAIIVDQTGPYVLVVNGENKVEQRRIRPGGQYDSRVIVGEGLKQGEQVIVEGLQKVRPGQPVAVSTAAQTQG
jgi:membrane fusion protein (multidrug efflux system)